MTPQNPVDYSDAWAQRIDSARRALVHIGPAAVGFFVVLGLLAWMQLSISQDFDALLKEANAESQAIRLEMQRIAAAVEELDE